MAKGLSGDRLSELFVEKIRAAGYTAPYIAQMGKDLKLTKGYSVRIGVLKTLKERYPKEDWYPDKIENWNDAWALMNEIERRGIVL